MELKLFKTQVDMEFGLYRCDFDCAVVQLPAKVSDVTISRVTTARLTEM